MDSKVDKIIQLIFSGNNNTQVAIQLLKNDPKLKQQLENEFSTTLSILGKKTFKSILSLLQKHRQNNKMSKSEKFALISHPKLAERVTEIHLADYRLNELPDNISNLSNLKFIDLSINKLSSLPLEFTKINSLEKVYLTRNQFSSFPIALAHNQNLIELDLCSNKISSISPILKNLKNLSKLNLGVNQLSSIPDEITYLEKLEELILVDNKIQKISNNIGALSNLKMLNIWGWKNRFKELPDSFKLLSNLESLTISSSKKINNLSVIGNCINLKFLSLGLSEGCPIPDEIETLQKLIRLDICTNKNYRIEILPQSIEKLQSLQSLTIRGHRIKKSAQKKLNSILPNCQITFIR